MRAFTLCLAKNRKTGAFAKKKRSIVLITNLHVGTDTQSVKDRGVNVFRSAGCFDGDVANRIGFAQDQSTVNTGSGKHDGIAVWEMIAASAAVDSWSPSELGQEHYERIVKFSTLNQILNECRGRAIPWRQKIVLQPIEIVAVCIPIVAGCAVEITGAQIDGDERYPCISQSPAQQCALASDMVAVKCVRFFFLFRQIKSQLHIR